MRVGEAMGTRWIAKKDEATCGPSQGARQRARRGWVLRWLLVFRVCSGLVCSGLVCSGLVCSGLLESAAWAQVPPPPDDTEHVPFTSRREVPYVTRGERTLTADLFLPETAGPHPTVLLIHGGGWMSGNKSRMYFHGRYLAKRGYTAMAIDYRLAPESKHPAQLEDCRAALAWLGEQAATYRVDTTRMAAWGYSAGGHLACLLGAVAHPAAGPDHPPIRAVVAGGAPCDFMTYPPEDRGLLYWLGAGRSEATDVYRQASPFWVVDRQAPPMFLFHGSNDNLVPPENAEKLVRRLRELGVRAEFELLPDRNHIGAFLNREITVAAADFLDSVWRLDAASQLTQAAREAGQSPANGERSAATVPGEEHGP